MCVQIKRDASPCRVDQFGEGSRLLSQRKPAWIQCLNISLPQPTGASNSHPTPDCSAAPALPHCARARETQGSHTQGEPKTGLQKHNFSQKTLRWTNRCPKTPSKTIEQIENKIQRPTELDSLK